MENPNDTAQWAALRVAVWLTAYIKLNVCILIRLGIDLPKSAKFEKNCSIVSYQA
jgi:hypothetical protein